MICSRVLPVGIGVILTITLKFITIKVFFVKVSLSFKALIVVFLIEHYFVSNNFSDLFTKVFGFF